MQALLSLVRLKNRQIYRTAEIIRHFNRSLTKMFGSNYSNRKIFWAKADTNYLRFYSVNWGKNMQNKSFKIKKNEEKYLKILKKCLKRIN